MLSLTITAAMVSRVGAIHWYIFSVLVALPSSYERAPLCLSGDLITLMTCVLHVRPCDLFGHMESLNNF